MEGWVGRTDLRCASRYVNDELECSDSVNGRDVTEDVGGAEKSDQQKRVEGFSDPEKPDMAASVPRMKLSATGNNRNLSLPPKWPVLCRVTRMGRWTLLTRWPKPLHSK